MNEYGLGGSNTDKYSLRGKVFHKLREDILNGKYKENEELREAAIGEEFGRLEWEGCQVATGEDNGRPHVQMETGSHEDHEGVRGDLGRKWLQNTVVNQVASSGLWGWPRGAPSAAMVGGVLPTGRDLAGL